MPRYCCGHEKLPTFQPLKEPVLSSVDYARVPAPEPMQSNTGPLTSGLFAAACASQSFMPCSYLLSSSHTRLSESQWHLTFTFCPARSAVAALRSFPSMSLKPQRAKSAAFLLMPCMVAPMLGVCMAVNAASADISCLVS